MSDDFEFDTIGGGDWVKGSDHIDQWVLIRVIDTSTRDGVYGEQTVLEADWIIDLLGEGPRDFERLLNSDNYIANKCVGKNLVVGVIRQAPPKQKGFKGGIYLDQPEGNEMDRAITKAKAYLAAEKEAKAKAKAAKVQSKEAAGNPAEQELTDLLAGL